MQPTLPSHRWPLRVHGRLQIISIGISCKHALGNIANAATENTKIKTREQ